MKTAFEPPGAPKKKTKLSLTYDNFVEASTAYKAVSNEANLLRLLEIAGDVGNLWLPKMEHTRIVNNLMSKVLNYVNRQPSGAPFKSELVILHTMHQLLTDDCDAVNKMLLEREIELRQNTLRA
jgi:hypothetical protein